MIGFLLQANWQQLEQRIGSERVSNVLWFAGIIICTLLLKRPVSKLIARLGCVIANRFSDKRHGQLFQSLIVKPVEVLVITILFYVAVNQLSVFLHQVIFRRMHADKVVEIRVSDVADKLFLFLIILFLVWTVSRILDFIFHVIISGATSEHNREKEQLLPLLKEVVKIVIWTIGIFWLLGSVFNVNIPALITGLGIGGVAIALAAKESVENFFASFTILTDKPFQTGESIKLGSLGGKVEHIGFRSTRLRSADGSLFIIPNKKLVNENLENLTQRDTSGVKVTLHIKYGLAPEKLDRFLEELKLMLREFKDVIDPVSVTLETFGENAFQIVMNYHLPEPMTGGVAAGDIKQAINVKAYAIASKYVMAPGDSGKAISKADQKEGESPVGESEDL